MPKLFVGDYAVDERQFNRVDEDLLLHHDVQDTFCGTTLVGGGSKSKIGNCYMKRNMFPIRIAISESQVC